MTSQYNVSDRWAILKSVRLRIEVLEAVTSSHKTDKELGKRLKEAKIEEAVIREKLKRFESKQ